MFNLIREFYNDESGATMVEYALIVALIAIVVAATVLFLGEKMDELFQKVADCVEDTSKCGDSVAPPPAP